MVFTAVATTEQSANFKENLQMKVSPSAFTPDDKTTLWILDHNVAVFNAKQAEIVMYHKYDDLKVWAIKDGKALLVTDLYKALEFFNEG